MDNNFRVSVWKDYERIDFEVCNRDCWIIKPKKALEGNPWVWRPEFFDAFPQVDMDLLNKGWHLAYIRVSDMYGCPEAIEIMHKFQCFVEEIFKLAKKTVLFGFSRGGLYAFNYTVKYSSKVDVLYLDAPVLDIKSWPGGKGKGKGANHEWKECLDIYNLTEENVNDFKGNPLNKAEILVKKDIPIIAVVGDIDNIVPYEENTKLLEKIYKDFKGTIEVIHKPFVGHHPHSLKNPKSVVDFILKHSSTTGILTSME